jgi:hypothetical protein
MNNTLEPILLVIVLLAVAGPIAFMRFSMTKRHLSALESIAESLKKLVELQSKQR